MTTKEMMRPYEASENPVNADVMRTLQAACYQKILVEFDRGNKDELSA